MSQELLVLTATAGTLGFVHTVLGPDHYLPFVVLARARRWSKATTSLVTVLCGIGHVGSSIAIGAVGIALGVALAKLEWIESTRGDVAAWLLTAFGLLYMVWGIRRAVRQRTHSHAHSHLGGEVHHHTHTHEDAHLHPHDQPSAAIPLTPWILFTIFVFGPCEPLIPLLMYPAAAESAFGIALVAGVFGAATIATMLVIVLALSFGLQRLPTHNLERYSHALAGAAIFLCGVAIHLGL